MEKIHSYIDVFERIIKILKVKISDKLILAIGLSGLAMMSKNIFLDIISQILKKEFDLSITGENDVLWGFLLVLLSVVLVLKKEVLTFLNNYLKHKKWKINMKLFSTSFIKLNKSINKYTMYFNTYTNYIANKAAGIYKYEKDRVKIDQNIIDAINVIGTFFPKELSLFLYQYRKIVSCSFHKEIDIYYALHDICLNDYQNTIRPITITNAAIEIYNDFTNAINDLRNYLLYHEYDKNVFLNILKKNYIDDKYNTTRKSIEHKLALQYILYPEYSAKWKDNDIV